jgi:FixJ family two-component response regulator
MRLEVTKNGKIDMDQNLSWSGSYRDIKPTKELFVVDDDEYAREILAALLVQEGFSLVAFEDGEAFLAAAATRVPICLFLDVIMPGRSGPEILLELRARRYWTPAFMTSVRDDFPTVVEVMKSGAHDYIRKPFDRGATAALIHSAIEMWSRRERENGTLDLQINENSEWFRLTPSEKDTVLLMRMVNS